MGRAEDVAAEVQNDLVMLVLARGRGRAPLRRTEPMSRSSDRSAMVNALPSDDREFHCTNASSVGLTVCPVAVADQKLRSFIPGKGFSYLSRNPLGGPIGSHSDSGQLPSRMAEYHQPIKQLEGHTVGTTNRSIDAIPAA
jgi:hypothetical protein